MTQTQAAHSGVAAAKSFMQSIRVSMTASFDVLPNSLHRLFTAHSRDRSTFFCPASVPSSIAIAWKARKRSPTYWLYTLAVLARPAQHSRTVVLASASAAPKCSWDAVPPLQESWLSTLWPGVSLTLAVGSLCGRTVVIR